MTLDEADVIQKEAFERRINANDETARRVARRDLDAANAAWEKWARKVGLQA